MLQRLHRGTVLAAVAASLEHKLEGGAGREVDPVRLETEAGAREEDAEGQRAAVVVDQDSDAAVHINAHDASNNLLGTQTEASGAAVDAANATEDAGTEEDARTRRRNGDAPCSTSAALASSCPHADGVHRYELPPRTKPLRRRDVNLPVAKGLPADQPARKMVVVTSALTKEQMVR